MIDSVRAAMAKEAQRTRFSLPSPSGNGPPRANLARSLRPEELGVTEEIPSYWDRRLGMRVVQILPGQAYVTHRDEMISTILGSCVSACIRDPKAAVGGMNHFMLPRRGCITSGEAGRYGEFAMESLIEDLVTGGACESDLEVKVFGGGRVLDSDLNIGDGNIRFVHEFLYSRGLKIVAEDVGGPFPRRIHYFPASGRVRMRRLPPTVQNALVDQESSYEWDLVVKIASLRPPPGE
ncbi:MAG: hypothetical protein OEZ06_16415 [Myxococcales bacterium]|nr:hypothetical protein [Myxococcales bacterium]